MEEDYEVNASLYSQLQSAAYDSNGDTMIGGIKYRRLQKEDAIYSISGDKYYYSWKDSITYHYFRYDPIKWRVLNAEGSTAFLLADQVLDNQTYNLEYTKDVTWETSTIRSWLNEYEASGNAFGTDYSSQNFIDGAFSFSEQGVIKTTNIVNDNNIRYGTEGGNNTIDKIFLLSESEVYSTHAAQSYGFKELYNILDEARRTKSSTYAKAMGICVNTPISYVGNCNWWLRSPGGGNDGAAFVYYCGDVGNAGNYVSCVNFGVRPALNLNLSSNLWSYAGTVCSDGTVNESGISGGGSGSGSSGGNVSNDPFVKKSEDNIKSACFNLENLGKDELKGPELGVAGYKFNLFKMDINMSLPFYNEKNIKIKVDSKDKTAEVLLGINEKELNTSDNDNYWTQTYREVKSLVSACSGETDSTKLWNRFSKLRGKLKSFDANAVFKAKGNYAGYMKLQMNDNGTIQKILEGGMAAGFEANGSVKTPLWWIVYSEFKLGGSIDGKAYSIYDNQKVIANIGELELAIKPSVALGADAVIVDVKGGIEGKIAGKVTLPWEEFKKSVTAYLTGKAFIKVDAVIPHLSGEFPYNFPRVELYPNLGKVTKTMSTLRYEESDPVTRQMIKAMSADSENAVDTTKDSLVYEKAKPKMISLSDGKIPMIYLDDTDGEAKLMYSIYDGNKWSEASKVYGGGNLDTAGYLYRYGD